MSNTDGPRPSSLSHAAIRHSPFENRKSTSQRSEDAFRELVARHVNFVYSAALRQLRNPHLAEEATQAAFIALAGKATQLRRPTIVAGWLHHSVRHLRQPHPDISAVIHEDFNREW